MAECTSPPAWPKPLPEKSASVLGPLCCCWKRCCREADLSPFNPEHVLDSRWKVNLDTCRNQPWFVTKQGDGSLTHKAKVLQVKLCWFFLCGWDHNIKAVKNWMDFTGCFLQWGQWRVWLQDQRKTYAWCPSQLCKCLERMSLLKCQIPWKS